MSVSVSSSRGIFSGLFCQASTNPDSLVSQTDAYSSLSLPLQCRNYAKPPVESQLKGVVVNTAEIVKCAILNPVKLPNASWDLGRVKDAIEFQITSSVSLKLCYTGSIRSDGRTSHTTKKRGYSLRIRFWGVRGTIPTPGPETMKYGGNTSCIDILTSDQQIIILDAGSGIRKLGQQLQQEYSKRILANIFISHTHWDHIQGFPFFAPAFGRNNRFVLVGQKRVDQRLEEILAGQFIEPYLPFSYKTLPADLIVKEVADGETLVVGDKTTVEVAELRHPGGCLGFRIENEGAVFTYCSDTSHAEDELGESILRLAQGADVLVHDAHFATYEETRRFADWGHSCWLEAAQVAVEANVKTLGLFHYAPDLTDDELDGIVGQARNIFPNTFLTREGMVIDLPLTDSRLPE